MQKYMADDLYVDDSNFEGDRFINNKVEERIKDLSQKVKLTAQERDELKGLNQQLSSEKENLSKEVDFYKNFSSSTGKYPGAAEHVDDIRAKVLAGYDVEDATVAVLARAGKLSGSTPAPEREIRAGGSATNLPPSGGTKNLRDMSREEKRAALMEAETRGDISLS